MLTVDWIEMRMHFYYFLAIGEIDYVDEYNYRDAYRARYFGHVCNRLNEVLLK